MREHLGFLKVSSVVVKIAAWIFLSLGILGSVSFLLGRVSGIPRWVGLIFLGVYTFLSLLLFLVAKMADLLVKIISTGGVCLADRQGSACGGNEIKKD